MQRVIIGEIHLYDLEHWVTYFGPGDEMHLPFNFGLLKTPWTARGVATHVEEVEAVTNAADGRWPSYVMGNHDEHRIASRIGHDQARVAMMLLLTLRGTPTLYYGDELGHPDVDVPLELEQDPWGLRVPGLALSRDPARTPMPWEASNANAGCHSQKPSVGEFIGNSPPSRAPAASNRWAWTSKCASSELQATMKLPSASMATAASCWP